MGWRCVPKADQRAHSTQLMGLPLQGKCWTSLGPPTLQPAKAALTFALHGQGKLVYDPSLRLTEGPSVVTSCWEKLLLQEVALPGATPLPPPPPPQPSCFTGEDDTSAQVCMKK